MKLGTCIFFVRFAHSIANEKSVFSVELPNPTATSLKFSSCCYDLLLGTKTRREAEDLLFWNRHETVISSFKVDSTFSFRCWEDGSAILEPVEEDTGAREPPRGSTTTSQEVMKYNTNSLDRWFSSRNKTSVRNTHIFDLRQKNFLGTIMDSTDRFGGKSRKIPLKNHMTPIHKSKFSRLRRRKWAKYT